MRKPTFLIFIILITLSASCARKTPLQTAQLEVGSQYDTLEPELTDPGNVTPLNDNLLSPQEMRALKSKYAIRFNQSPYAQQLIRAQFIFLHRDVNTKVKTWLRRAELYLPYAQKVFREQGLPEDLAYLAFIESGYNPQAVSRSGAAGIWQFMPFTGRRFGLHCDWWVDERRDPYAASHAAASYLSKLHDMFGDWSLAIAAYNAGEGKISRAVAACGARDFFELHQKNPSLPEEKRLREETLYYVPRFAAMVKIANNFELLGYGPFQRDAAPNLAQIKAGGGTDLPEVARVAGLQWDTFKQFNPAFRRQGTPPGRTCTLYVPVKATASVKSFLASSKARHDLYQPYVVVRGDSWNRIAQRFHVSVATLKKVNNYRSNLLRPGQRIAVPTAAGQTTMVASSTPRTSKKAAAPRRSYKTAAYKTQTGRYRVRTGDTLYSLSKRFGCSVASLMRMNNFGTPGELISGKSICIPGQNNGPRTYALRTSRKTRASIPQTRSANYRVKSGDTLWSIARKFSVSPTHLLRWNDMNRHSVIQPGDKVLVYLD